MNIIFSIEKPSYMPFLPDRLQDRQRTGEWYGEIKLNENRCFIVVDAKGYVSVRGYRDSNTPLPVAPEAIEQLQDMRLPLSSVFDGGHLKRKDLGQSRLWIFDVLCAEGKRLDLTCEDRCQYRDELITPTTLIWMPMQTKLWLAEFSRMSTAVTPLIRRNALRCGIPVDKFYGLVEGLVVKRRDSRLTYPRNVKIMAASYFKLLRDRKLSGLGH